MPLNPPRVPTTGEKVQSVVARAEHQLYRRSVVIASFLAGIILGYAVGAW